MIIAPNFIGSILGGLACFGLGAVMTVAAFDFGQRTSEFHEQGVRTTAVVCDIRPEQPDPHDQYESTVCILEFDSRQVERRPPGKHDIGEKFDITYQPDTMELRFTSQSASPLKVWSVLSVVIFVAVTLCALGGWGVISGLRELSDLCVGWAKD